MFRTITPEEAGISSKQVLSFLKLLDDHHFCTHSILMARGSNVFAEAYYAPYHQDSLHRIYSVSKSFVSVAIGLAAEEGLIGLDDPMVRYFPEYASPDHPQLLQEMTIREMLTMETCTNRQEKWFYRHLPDRRDCYFTTPMERIPGTTWCYDSPGAFMMGCIVERVTGMPFLDYLKDRFLRKGGFSESSTCLKCPGGYSFADSGVLCTTRDLLVFARFVMDGGVIDGKRCMNADYLAQATKKQVDNNYDGFLGPDGYGYGYQIWKMPNDGFAFIGMGDQVVICDPEHDFVFIITADHQGVSTAARMLMQYALYHDLIPCLSTPLPPDPSAQAELQQYLASRKLVCLQENPGNPFAREISGKTWQLDANPMGIRWLRLDFSGDEGMLTWENDQGRQEMAFGLGRNAFGLFPHQGYSDMTAGLPEEGHCYACATSADWPEAHKLRIRVQIIDKYLGNLTIVMGFKDNRVGLRMSKNAEAFLDEYQGYANGVMLP